MEEENNNVEESWEVKPFKAFIAELFDKPLPYKKVFKSGGVYEFSIKTNGTTKIVKVAIIDYDDGSYEVEFNVDKRHDLTGLAGTAAIKIFTTVVAIMLDFVKAVQPNKIEFSAAKSVVSGDSRSKLYDKMIKRLTPKGYVYAIKKLGDTVYYTLTKKNK